ncbi:MAG: hypothetical protein IT529_09145 [Burkholderiales bacterium]|nr:hypothetical protein [Burkholderiales bacterium]
MTTEQPSGASAAAHALPSPRDEAHTIALRSWIPRSIFVLLIGNPVRSRRFPVDYVFSVV